MQSIPVINQTLENAVFPGSSKAILFYASAHWCGPCRAFTPILKGFYEAAKAHGAELEIIFLSSDRSEKDMISYYKESHGSWLAVPFFSPQRQFLSTHFNVRGIPSLVLLNRGTMQPAEVDARSLVQQAAMMGGSERIKAMVQELRERSGATLFDSVPRAMNSLTSEDRSAVFELMSKLITNISEHPTEPKYRQLKADNATLKKSILDRPCGDAPLRALGFYPDGQGNYSYRPSFVDPVTAKLILVNRESNGLALAAMAAPVGRPLVNKTATVTVESVKEIKFKVLYRDMVPQVTDGFPISEGLDVIKAITESITDVPSERQRVFCPSVHKEGCLESADARLITSALELSTSPILDLIVLRMNTPLPETDEEAHSHAQRLRQELIPFGNHSYLTNIMLAQMYEVPSNQFKALSVIPMSELHASACSRLKQAIPIPDLGAGKSCYEECLFVELLDWFKSKFFSWMDKPRCAQCNATSTLLTNGGATPSSEEAKGLATRTEIFTCSICGFQTRFPRFNHPAALLASKSGRCGEWSNCFALIARAVGFEVRRVYDSADHVWVEVWMEHRREWMHADPCENAYGKPLLYAIGWSKKPSWTVAVARDGIVDVTRRYNPSGDSIESQIPETSISSLNELLMKHWDSENTSKPRNSEEQVQLAALASTDRRSGGNGLSGRTTGSVEWRTQRGETGLDKVSKLKRIFNELIQSGMSSNDAAMQALRRLRE